MKRNINTAIGFAIWLTCVVFPMMGCKQGMNVSDNSDHHFMMADTMIAQYNRRHSEREWTKRFEGKVSITTDEKRIIVKPDPSKMNDTISYFLYTKTSQQFKQQTWDNAELIYADRVLIVNSLESSQSLILSILGDSEPAYMNDLKNPTRVIGYGLGYRRVKNNPPQTAPLCSCELNGTPEDNCTTGGEGKLSCSTGNPAGSCRISCESQYFPCCLNPMD
jgi:hypothetical protein